MTFPCNKRASAAEKGEKKRAPKRLATDAQVLIPSSQKKTSWSPSTPLLPSCPPSGHVGRPATVPLPSRQASFEKQGGKKHSVCSITRPFAHVTPIMRRCEQGHVRDATRDCLFFSLPLFFEVSSFLPSYSDSPAQMSRRSLRGSRPALSGPWRSHRDKRVTAKKSDLGDLLVSTQRGHGAMRQGGERDPPVLLKKTRVFWLFLLFLPPCVAIQALDTSIKCSS